MLLAATMRSSSLVGCRICSKPRSFARSPLESLTQICIPARCIHFALTPLHSHAGASGRRTTVIDIDVDIGADAVDYNAIANQESLSGLETEMRKLEAVASEIVNEMDYLKKREMKMRDTNGEFAVIGRMSGGVAWEVGHRLDSYAVNGTA